MHQVGLQSDTEKAGHIFIAVPLIYIVVRLGLFNLDAGLGSISGVDVSGYNAPAAGYGAPAPSYNAPAPSYNAPAPSYKAPAPSYNAPAPSYNAPAPASGYTSDSLGAPAPASNLATFGRDAGLLGGAYLRAKKEVGHTHSAECSDNHIKQWKRKQERYAASLAKT